MKIRKLLRALVISSAFCICMVPMTCLAQGNKVVDTNKENIDKKPKISTNIEKDTEKQLHKEEVSMEALTPDGNLTLVDDYGAEVKQGKQFITVVTKTGNYFYIIIDRDDKGNETVHFLNMVEEDDLLALMDEKVVAEIEKQEVIEEQIPKPVKEEPSKGVKKDNKGVLLFCVLIFLATLSGLGVYVYTKVFKKDEQEETGEDPDDDFVEKNYLDGLAEESNLLKLENETTIHKGEVLDE